MITDVDHIEFYVGDAQQSSFYLCTAFGFRLCGQAGPETGLRDHRSLLLRQGRIQLVLTSPLTKTAAAGAYVGRHGDGVAAIAFGTDDARGAFREAVDRGATPVREPAEYADGDAKIVIAEIAGFGDVTHRFVERQGAPGSFLPGVMESFVPDPEDGEMVLERIDHIAVCLPAGDLDPAVDRYQKVLGFSKIFEEHIEVGKQAMNSKVVQSPSGGVTFTLLEPDESREPGQINDFIERHTGAGVQHLAFLTGDIIDAVERLQRRGARFLPTPASYYDQLVKRLGAPEIAVGELRMANVLVDRDHWGEIFQIFTQSMHVRRTYFMEVVERRGARTFGSGNIKALYEAVERELSNAAEAAI
jgi:4-hydroxymandelate synthase